MCTHAGHQIIEDLLTYEMKRELGSSVGAGAAEYSSSSSDEGGEEKGSFSNPMHTWQTTASPLNSGEEEDDSEDEYTMRVRYADIILSWNVLKDVVGSLDQSIFQDHSHWPLLANMKQHLTVTVNWYC